MLGNYKLHDYVRIVADNDYNGLIGIIDEINEEVIVVFCTLKPVNRYVITQDNLNHIELAK